MAKDCNLQSSSHPTALARAGAIFVALGLAPACDRASQESVRERLTVYCSVDETFARDVFRGYEQRTGVPLSVVFDTEAGKTTGLVGKIIAEAGTGRSRADVFWSGEVFHTISLARRGLLEAYESPMARDIPDRFKDRDHLWTGIAVRPRVIAFDPKRVSRENVPRSWESLSDRPYAARLAIANPLFGTTQGHVAAMFALWGPERGRRFLIRLRDAGAQLADGNSATVRAVIDGRADFAATDSDDVWVAQRTGASLDFIYPDMGDGGTLLVPCSIAIVKGTSRRDAARRLLDYLVSAEVERRLANSDSRNIPVRAILRDELGVPWPPESKVDYDAVADAMPEALRAVREILLR